MRERQTPSALPTMAALTVAIVLLGLGGLWRLTKPKNA
jgi:hypothetical protein